jgi:endonuclease/exonuclease/phosphatase family metal-dependent hydrolase
VANPAAADLRIATWNVDGVQKTPEALAANAANMITDVGDLDILVIQEVIDSAQVAAISSAIGMPFWVISDLSPPVSITGNGFGSLEVAILSRTPVERAAEWDTTGRGEAGDGFPPRSSDPELTTEEILPPVTLSALRPTRGFLRVGLAAGLTVYAVHWKSSRNEGCTLPDLENAALREIQARGIVADAQSFLSEGASIIVAGDFNIQAVGSGLRAGRDPDADCRPVGGTCRGACGPDGEDGYDDSIAILFEIANEARLLSNGLGDTYIRRRFNEGAIDHIFVAGPLVSTFSSASLVETDSDVYAGSDHVPVFAQGDITLASPRVRNRTSEISELRALLREMEARLDRLEGAEVEYEEE